jgi:disulfide bond formation protein DsbB
VAGVGVSLWAFLGGLVALRNVILQRFPATNNFSEGCVVSFGSFVDDIVAALGGTGNCASVEWTLFHLSIADWSLIAFTGLTMVGIWIFSQSKSQGTEISRGTPAVE